MPFEPETSRLRLRRPTAGDLEAYTTLHTDPRTYAHAPGSMPDAEGCRVRLDADLDHWSEHGFGYLAVEERASGRVVGWGGVRRWSGAPGEPLNLYYRLAYDVLGCGHGREIARAVVAAAVEERPDDRVRARVKPHNRASLATARAAGLLEVGTAPHPADGTDDAPSVVLEAPHFTSTTTAVARVLAEVLDLWTRVNDSGGAVGFSRGAPRQAVADRLADHAALLTAERAVLGLLRAPDGRLLGSGLWQREAWSGFAHRLTLWRLMVDPAEQRRGHGGLLLSGMHGLARRWSPSTRLWCADYRSGQGLGRFYRRWGWYEVGRVPTGIELPGGERGDEVHLARRPEGGLPVADGRP